MGCVSSVAKEVQKNVPQAKEAAAAAAGGGNRLFCISNVIDQYKVGADGASVEEEKQLGSDNDWDPAGDHDDVWYRTYHKGYIFTSHKDGSLWGTKVATGESHCYAQNGFETILFLVADPEDDYIYALDTDQLWYFTVDHANRSIKWESYDPAKEDSDEWEDTDIEEAVLADNKIICNDKSGALYFFDLFEGGYVEVERKGYDATVAMAFHNGKLYTLSDDLYAESVDLASNKITSTDRLTQGEGWDEDGVADYAYHKASGTLIVATEKDELWSIKLADGSSTKLKGKGEGWDETQALICC